MVSMAQMSPLGVAMTPCILPSRPLKFQPSGGDSGLPVLSNFEIELVPVLVSHTFSWASSVRPKPGPPRPPPVKPVTGGDSGSPLGANLERVPSHRKLWLCEPIMKLSAVQALPSLSNISLPPPANPPPVNLIGSTQALGAKVRYGVNGVGRLTTLPLGKG